MSRYIDADKLQEAFKELHGGKRSLLIDTQPTADVVEVVRCKDCKHYGSILYSGTQFEYGKCFGHEESDYIFEVKPYDFCSRAERRTDE